MSIGIGIIGAGVMGADHARTVASAVGGAHLAALSDADADRAARVAAETGARRCHADSMALIADPAVDAVLIASPDATHAAFVLACLNAGKPVLCEKPLAATLAEAEVIIAAEKALGRRLVQVGFMRRFDPAYAGMKARLDAGEIGPAVMLHAVHRNAAVPPWFTSEMVITNSAVHDIDVARFLLGQEIVAATVFAPPVPAGALRDRQFLVMETAGGQLATVELFVNAAYGYDVRAELVGERGTLTRAPRDAVALRQSGRESGAFALDWRGHFAAAYQRQLQAWVQSIRSAVPVGPSAWDGYAATAIATACVGGLARGERVAVDIGTRPALYD